MPVPIIAAVVTGVIGMVEQNVQTKAAIKNNENQQAAAEQNAQSNWQKGNQQISPFMPSGGGTPTGTTGAPPAGPTAGQPPKPGPLSPQQIVQRLGPQQAPPAAAQATPAGTPAQGAPAQTGTAPTPEQLATIKAMAQHILSQPSQSAQQQVGMG